MCSSDLSDERVDESYAESVERLDRMQAELLTPLAGDVSEIPSKISPHFNRNMTEAEFKSKVEIAKEEILRISNAYQNKKMFIIKLFCSLFMYRLLCSFI